MIRVGSRVRVMRAIDGKSSVQYEKGKVIYIGRRVLVEFDYNICGHSGNGLGKRRRCWMVPESAIKELK